jgi:tRNA threonylcarbamoyl adenosine modification protein (Sua5/YciO/YrdC/YwlC family)
MSSRPQATEFEDVIRSGGVVLFPSDTVYGLACDPESEAAVERLYRLKGRAPEKAAAVMFFEFEAALEALPELGTRTRRALRMLMPGPITVLLPNPAHRFPLASIADPDTLGLRVVSVPSLFDVEIPVLQSSANPSGEADVSRLSDVAPAMRAGAAMEIDGGELPGRASTVVDLRRYEGHGSWSIVRAGAASETLVESLLGADYIFEPETYDADVIAEVHDYEELQDRLVEASGGDRVQRILELGTGTGETARRLLSGHPEATLVGVDGTPVMLAAAARSLPADRFTPRLSLLQEALPDGPFDLVASALAIHHLEEEEKAGLFGRVHAVLRPGGRFVLADLVVPEDPSEAALELHEGFDKPSSAADQLSWLRAAGFSASLFWRRLDLVVIVVERDSA